jgi:hypothetical protein
MVPVHNRDKVHQLVPHWDGRVSILQQSPPRALAEPDVNLSANSAPSVQLTVQLTSHRGKCHVGVTDRYYGATYDRGYGASSKWPKAGPTKCRFTFFTPFRKSRF